MAGQKCECRTSKSGVKTGASREETDKSSETARRGTDGGMQVRIHRVNWGRSGIRSGLPLNDKDLLYKP